MPVSIHHIPRLAGLDHTLALLRDPYEFISRHCRSFGWDVFEMRLLLRRTLCMTGAEAAKVFYDPTRFQRRFDCRNLACRRVAASICAIIAVPVNG